MSFKSSQKGYVMVLVLIGAMIISAAMMSTIFVSTKSQKVVKNFKESVQTLNAADAAIKMAKGSINEWLVDVQLASGTQTDFSPLLTASAAAGALDIPGDATDWGNLDLFGSTVRVNIWDEEGVSDTDRIMVIEAEAINNTSQRVRIQSYVQAPSVENTSGLPGLQGAASICADVAGLKQTVSVGPGNAILSGNDITSLPAWGCSGGGCKVNTFDAGSAENRPPAVLSDTGNQTVTSSGAATFQGSPNTVQPMSGNCDQIRNFINQVSLLSDSLPNVINVNGGAITSAHLGTRANPKITLVTGPAAKAGKGKDKTPVSTISINNNTRGAGILILQAPTETADVVIEGGTNFYYEGLIVVYGDEKTTFTTKGTEALYGGIIIATGSNDPAEEVRLEFRNAAEFKFSNLALAQADKALGGGSDVITEIDDPRNSVVTIGWFEDYDF